MCVFSSSGILYVICIQYYSMQIIVLYCEKVHTYQRVHRCSLCVEVLSILLLLHHDFLALKYQYMVLFSVSFQKIANRSISCRGFISTAQDCIYIYMFLYNYLFVQLSGQIIHKSLYPIRAIYFIRMEELFQWKILLFLSHDPPARYT